MELTIDSGIEMNDGRMIPRLGFGTFQLEGEAEVRTAVEAALETGYRLIDCARFYNNERLVGDALAAAAMPRDQIFVTSKVWNDRQIDGTVRESVEESLRDLQLDYLDLLLVHWPVEGRFLETWKTFIDLRDEGLVRSIGVSNHRPEHLGVLVDETGVAPAVDQMEHHPYMQDEATLEYCDKHGVVVEAWSPLGRGECLGDPVIGKIAKAHDATPAQVILAWELCQGVVPLPRSKNPERIRQNAGAADVMLDLDEIAAIGALNQGRPVTEGIDPEHFNAHLNTLSSHFD